MFFPRNSFVTNTTLTHTNTPRKEHPNDPPGNDHIACYGGSTQAAQVTWHNSSGGPLVVCFRESSNKSELCTACGGRCQGNGGVGADPPLNGHTDIHMYTDITAYLNQDLECRVSGGQSAFIGVYLVNGGQFVISHLEPCTTGISTWYTVPVVSSIITSKVWYYVTRLQVKAAKWWLGERINIIAYTINSLHLAS